MPKDNNWTIVLDRFYSGYSPMAFQSDLTEFGGGGHASSMRNVDIINGVYLTQGPGLNTLTNGTQAGVVTELIKFIMDRATSNDVSFALGTSKLFKISRYLFIS